jgi:hypothetical protein
MFKMAQSGTKLLQLRARDWLCLLVAVTFLYNPFLAASLSSNGLSVCHLPSFRATVAHSELLKFKPKELNDRLAAPECDFRAQAVLSPVYVSAPTQSSNVGEPIPTQDFVVGNLWFRPPPAV